MRLEARAKINWTLDVLGQLENGYHVLEGAVRIRRYNKDALIPDEA